MSRRNSSGKSEKLRGLSRFLPLGVSTEASDVVEMMADGIMIGDGVPVRFEMLADESSAGVLGELAMMKDGVMANDVRR